MVYGNWGDGVYEILHFGLEQLGKVDRSWAIRRGEVDCWDLKKRTTGRKTIMVEIREYQ